MTTVKGQTDPEQLRAEIARTRAALGETVAALVAKTDVKARTKAAAGQAVDRARRRIGTAGAATAMVAVGLAAAAGLVVVLVRRGRWS
ncbi:hypothetical protein GCM10010399_13630 [Dactylosporangium fulvum]|uniref:DUF3618 domain-containing protein n=1 Tax=Dactylosporangium fulvum TaxID=53359 RepID=A0ABY5W5C9_9ACTN|nr:DUF3618 domain-containing protein [Dactylosporangium fulvum]UWP85218.1 DUF3618 domain-containing protein [Dactylosporangium fulvum]